MSLDQIITNLPNLKITDVSGSAVVKVMAEYQGPVACLNCNSGSLRIKHTFTRELKNISFGDRRSVLLLKSHKFYCKDCGKYFNQRFTGILPYKRATEVLRKEVSLKHHDGITQSKISKQYKLSCSTVEKWYQEFVDYENRKINTLNCPKVLGIDEHFFTKKKGYATTFANLSTSRVFDVALGRSEKALDPFMKRLRGRENVRVVLMDLSETYRSIAKKYFQNALIVADRFHVVRIINHHFMSVWKELDPNGKYNRGLLSLIRRHRWNLRDDQIDRFNSYLDSIPGLRPLYEFKQKLNKLMGLKTLRHKQFRKYIPIFLSMIEQLKNSGFKAMRKLGKTLDNWKEEIGRMLRFSKTNSITEGLHNKMEMLSRRAFGFRNFENYRLRVRVHCGAW